MDSVTQLVLGASVGYAVLGPKVGRKAALYGAVLGTLPDLDVFIPYGGPVEDFTYHRGFSHSFFVHLLVSPIIAWLITKIHPLTKIHYRKWILLVFLSLSTHALLDSLTVYGTQLLWPLTEYPFGISSLFIIDPGYTIFLLVAAVIIFLPIKLRSRIWINYFALSLSTCYALWSMGAKYVIDEKIEKALALHSASKGVYESTPAPFNTLLWRAISVHDDHYYEIYASIFDDFDQVSITEYAHSPELLNDIEGEWGLERLKWFTKGLYSVNKIGEEVIFSDLRMGVEGSYVFSFRVGIIKNNKVIPSNYEQIQNRPDIKQIPYFFDRISDPTVDLSLKARNANNIEDSLQD